MSPGWADVEDAMTDPQTAPADFEVDDATYNLLQALTSKLEAIEAYEQYEDDDPEGVFTTLIEDERRHAAVLMEALKRRMSQI
jgi:rubrerythrin